MKYFIIELNRITDTVYYEVYKGKKLVGTTTFQEAVRIVGKLIQPGDIAKDIYTSSNTATFSYNEFLQRPAMQDDF